jgi:hypothetical protein
VRKRRLENSSAVDPYPGSGASGTEKNWFRDEHPISFFGELRNSF